MGSSDSGSAARTARRGLAMFPRDLPGAQARKTISATAGLTGRAGGWRSAVRFVSKYQETIRTADGQGDETIARAALPFTERHRLDGQAGCARIWRWSRYLPQV
jgi:hypothetical protein